MVVKKKQAQLDELKSNVAKVQAEIKRYEEEQNKAGSFDVNQEIKKVLGVLKECLQYSHINKERAYKARLKQKEKERKEKERAYKQKLKDREKARKAELKAKEQARKEKLKK